LSNPEKILCVKWRRLGDTAIWTAALAALRKYRPHAQIDLHFPPAYQPLFIDDNRYGFAPADPRQWKYDVVLNFHASSRTARLSLRSGAKTKAIHFHSRRGKSFPRTLPIPGLGQPMSAIERDINVVRALGWNGESPATQLAISEVTKKTGKVFLEQRGWRGGPLVIFGVRASRLSKQWALTRYAEVARQLSKKGVQVGVVYDGARPDLPFDHALDLPTPDLNLLLGALSHAAQWVGSDSGVKHIACALGIPTLTLFGPESIGEWHGYPAPHQAIQKAVACRFNDPSPPDFAWCGEAICPFGSHACMNLIDPDEVLASLPATLVT